MLLYRISQYIKLDKHRSWSVHNGKGRVDLDVQEFVSSLGLTDEEILSKFDLTLEGNKLNPSEARQFIDFVRMQRNDAAIQKINR